MGVVVVGLTHQNAPLDVRERLAFGPDVLHASLTRLKEYVEEGVILSTCNRTEVYAVADQRRPARERLVAFLAETTGTPAPSFSPLLFDLWQEDVARHLFRVSAGLESMIVGEPQILGQLKRAFEDAAKAEAIGPHLSRLFRHALSVGKAARTSTAINRKAASVSFAAVELGRAALGSLAGRTVLIVGAGETGELAASTLLKHGAGALLVANRTASVAEEVAARHGGEAIGFEALGEACARADVVITCTSAPGHVITREMLAGAMEARPGRPLFIVDVAMPRDVEPAAGTLEGVHLRNLDDLQRVVAANLDARGREAGAVEALVDREVRSFVRWWDTLEVAPTISALVARAEAIRAQELTRALSRLEGLSERERNVVNAMSAAIVSKLLHEPIVRLKQHGTASDGRDFVGTVHDLFSLDRQAT